MIKLNIWSGEHKMSFDIHRYSNRKWLYALEIAFSVAGAIWAHNLHHPAHTAFYVITAIFGVVFFVGDTLKTY